MNTQEHLFDRIRKRETCFFAIQQESAFDSIGIEPRFKRKEKERETNDDIPLNVFQKDGIVNVCSKMGKITNHKSQITLSTYGIENSVRRK